METLEEQFIARGTDPEIARKAVEALRANPTLRGIVVSGKIAAGKDTIAPLILRILDPENDTVNVNFGAFLKDEATEVINIVRDMLEATDEAIAERVAEQMNVPMKNALFAIGCVRDEIRQGVGPVDGWDKTAGNRLLLQFWGTETRRAQVNDYFVNRGVQRVAECFAMNKSVFVTDARFTNELEGMTELGFTSFRIDVSPEEQKKRFFKREGKELQYEATLHPSETALDDYPNFDSRLLTDNMTPEEAAQALVALTVK